MKHHDQHETNMLTFTSVFRYGRNVSFLFFNLSPDSRGKLACEWWATSGYMRARFRKIIKNWFFNHAQGFVVVLYTHKIRFWGRHKIMKDPITTHFMQVASPHGGHLFEMTNTTLRCETPHCERQPQCTIRVHYISYGQTYMFMYL
jgi:hypothetical protein